MARAASGNRSSSGHSRVSRTSFTKNVQAVAVVPALVTAARQTPAVEGEPGSCASGSACTTGSGTGRPATASTMADSSAGPGTASRKASSFTVPPGI